MSKKVVFKPEELAEVKKEFRGVVRSASYEENPRFGGMQLHVVISTEAYEKDQHEWYPPSNRRLTKWAYLLEALAANGALREIPVKGETDEERIKSFAAGLVGMEFDWEERLVPTIAGRDVEVLLPVDYHGRKPIPAKPRVEEVGPGAPGAL